MRKKNAKLCTRVCRARSDACAERYDSASVPLVVFLGVGRHPAKFTCRTGALIPNNARPQLSIFEEKERKFQ